MQDVAFIILIIVGFVIAFTALWTGIVWLTSRLGGWADLAEEFPATGRIEGDTFKFCSARLRYVVNYSHCLTITVTPSGLHIIPMIFFRLGHPALLIPRQAIISMERGMMPFFGATKLVIRRSSGKKPAVITLYGKGLAEALDRWFGK